MSYQLTLAPSGKIITVKEGEDLLSVLREEEVFIKSSCGGHASCSDCIVKILEGKEFLEEPTFEEGQLLGNVFHITKERLACQTRINGDVTIDISKHDQKEDQERLRSKPGPSKTKIRKREEADQILQERKDKSLEKQKARDEREERSDKHWEKEKPATGFKRLGGSKRPTNMRPIVEDEKEEKKDVVYDKRDDFQKNRSKKDS